jgi:uncharacterized membrane-anchored protein YhcB (DUF1043 family)
MAKIIELDSYRKNEVDHKDDESTALDELIDAFDKFQDEFDDFENTLFSDIDKTMAEANELLNDLKDTNEPYVKKMEAKKARREKLSRFINSIKKVFGRK